METKMMKFVCTTNEIITIEQDGTSEILVEHHIKKVQPTLLVKLENLDLQIRLECTKEEFLEELSMHLGRLKCSTDEINFFLFNDFTNAIQVEDLYEDIFAEARRVTEKVIQQKDFNNYVRKMRVCRHEIKYLYSIWTRYDLNNEEQWNSIVEVLKDLDTLATSFEKKGKSSGPLIYTKYDNSKLSDIKNLKAMSNSDQISTFKSLFIQTEELDCEPAVRYLKKKVKQSCWFLNRRDVAAKNDSENEPSFAERYMKIRKQRRSFLKRRNVGAKNYLEDEVLTKRNSGSSEYAKTEEDQPSTSIEPSVITIEDSEDEVSSAERTSDDKSEDQGSSAERGSSPVTLMEEDQPSTSTGPVLFSFRERNVPETDEREYLVFPAESRTNVVATEYSDDQVSSAERTSDDKSEDKSSSAERGSSPVTVMEEDQPSASTGRTNVVATEYSDDQVSSAERGSSPVTVMEEDQPSASTGTNVVATEYSDDQVSSAERTSDDKSEDQGSSAERGSSPVTVMEEDQPSASTGRTNVVATEYSDDQVSSAERTSNEDSEGKGSSAERGSSPVTVMEEDQPSASTGTTVVATEYSEDHVSSTERVSSTVTLMEEAQPSTSKGTTVVAAEYSEDHVSSTESGTFEYANTEEDQPFTSIDGSTEYANTEEDQPSTYIDGSSEYANTEEDQPYTYIEETSNNYMMEEDQPSTSTGINVAATYDSECEILPEERTYETPENSESANAPIAGEEVLVDPVEEMLLSVVTDTVDPESIPDPEPEEEPVLIDLTESD
ncbi:uncharacterized protein LOC129960843 isoform X2 [Argiope bruennichi]|uniref:uncharacterized protein LOC129960843 isoform X2 n=1 Tax=Argiope bruennichi TaxID=94029 RepID=UPI002494838E|nr:uncharacterized protein LOC129960843 isoform X2 [Argiope bruennichi]